MRKLICWLIGHKWRKLMFTRYCERCSESDILDEVMDQFVSGWREDEKYRAARRQHSTHTR